MDEDNGSVMDEGVSWTKIMGVMDECSKKKKENSMVYTVESLSLPHNVGIIRSYL